MNPVLRKITLVVAAALAFVASIALGPGAAQAVVVRTAVGYRRPVGVGYRGVGVGYHPVARTAAVVGTAAVTAAVVGSVVNSIPPSCSTVMVGGVAYSQCGNTWYQPRYAGSDVTYVVVNPPPQ